MELKLHVVPSAGPFLLVLSLLPYCDGLQFNGRGLPKLELGTLFLVAGARRGEGRNLMACLCGVWRLWGVGELRSPDACTMFCCGIGRIESLHGVVLSEWVLLRPGMILSSLERLSCFVAVRFGMYLLIKPPTQVCL